ncbi:MAG: triose-phosphate isomerase [Clostridia bacterium]|nr:triose-phosphate isomerase [Clostridia bacterium]
MRRKVIAGNWKMYHNPAETKEFFEKFTELVKDTPNEVIICVPYIDVAAALESTAGTNIKIGTQNLNHEEAGALTGDVSCKMLQDIGIKYSIIGHSERRQYHHETDDFINLKIKAAFAHDIVPILCVGESLLEREKGIAKYKICTQIVMDFDGLTAEQAKKVVIAYEPIWAIGTGKTASAEDANEACKWIREEIRSLYGDEVADAIIIQYGGSVKPTNAKELFSMSDIDGGLVGGASLKPEDFAEIVNFERNENI